MFEDRCARFCTRPLDKIGVDTTEIRPSNALGPGLLTYGPNQKNICAHASFLELWAKVANGDDNIDEIAE